MGGFCRRRRVPGGPPRGRGCLSRGDLSFSLRTIFTSVAKPTGLTHPLCQPRTIRPVVPLGVLRVDLLCWTGLSGLMIFPFGLVRLIQIAYGVYYVVYYLVAAGGLFWRKLGVHGKASTIAAVGAATTAGIAVYGHHKVELSRQSHDVQMMRYKEDFKQKLQADTTERKYRLNSVSFERVGNEFVNVKPTGRFSSPRQVVRSELPPDGGMSCPYEEFVVPGWVSHLLLKGLTPTGAVLVCCVAVVIYLVRRRRE